MWPSHKLFLTYAHGFLTKSKKLKWIAIRRALRAIFD